MTIILRSVEFTLSLTIEMDHLGLRRPKRDVLDGERFRRELTC